MAADVGWWMIADVFFVDDVDDDADDDDNDADAADGVV